ncbi:MAG: nucleotidyltransferase substrate binding protein [Deltaproteobacteria bacterium]|nr:nucleotidyltransferase substrate binding protein [Deltaproteobacteria bacterium]
MNQDLDIRWKQRFQNYQKAVKQLKFAVAVTNPDVLQKQGVIQCFEYTFELAWKTLQDFLSQRRGYDKTRGPRPVLEQAFQDAIITDGITWFKMLESRNLTAHLYDEAEVEKIYQQIVHNYAALFIALEQFFGAQP